MNYAVMPVADYDATCEKIREKAEALEIKFEDTDFGYIRTAVFTPKARGQYIFTIEVKDNSKLDITLCVFANPEWDTMSPPGMFEVVNSNTISGKFGTSATRIFINNRLGLKAEDIVSATLSYNGEVVESFVVPKQIKSGELADMVDVVYGAGAESGKQAEYDRFWDELQRNGSRTNYLGAFAGYNEAMFKPKYDMQPANASNMFYQFEGKDLPELLQKAGVTLDFSKCTEFSNFFLWSEVEHIGVINASKGSHFDINYCQKLHTIDKIIPRSDQFQAISFTNAIALKNIIIEGEITGNFKIQNSPLTLESAKSIISALKNYSGTADEFKYTVSFSANTKALLEAEGATAPNGTTWLNYAFAKGWNR